MRRKEFLKKLSVASVALPIISSCTKEDDVLPALSVMSFTPTSGTPGDTVIITGTGFSATSSENTVKFNGTTATVTLATSTQLVVTVPSGTTTGPITITVSGETVATAGNFTVVSESSTAPTITSFSPTSGAVGDTVVITGTNFSSTIEDNAVIINGAEATVTEATEMQLTMTVPGGAETTGTITVTVDEETAVSSDEFTVTSESEGSEAPTISSFTTSGSVGSTITIIGTNFSTTASENTVTIGGVAATVTAATATQLMVVVPADAVSGIISVTVNGLTATIVSSFTVISASCVATDSETEGPFPTKDPSSLVRQNIVGDRTGIPFSITIVIQDKNNDCAPLEGALVDIWHCDKDGYYSEYGGTQMQTVDYTSVHFLRGRQTTNNDGVVGYTSIFPGWYTSRATHIHVHIYSSAGKSLLVTQIGFPEGTNSAVVQVNSATEYGYTKGMSGYTYNASDNVFSDSQDTEIGSVTGSIEEGFAINHTIVVSA